MKEKIFKMFYEILNKVTRLSCFEELISEIEEMDGNSVSDIITKLKLRVATMKITDYGKSCLSVLISTMQNLDELDFQLFVMAIEEGLVENPKIELENEIEELLELMKNSEDETWDTYLELAEYFEDLGKSKFELFKMIDYVIAKKGQQKRDGYIVDVDINTIFEALKNSNRPNNEIQKTENDVLSGESFLSTGGRH